MWKNIKYQTTIKFKNWCHLAAFKQNRTEFFWLKLASNFEISVAKTQFDSLNNTPRFLAVLFLLQEEFHFTFWKACCHAEWKHFQSMLGRYTRNFFHRCLLHASLLKKPFHMKMSHSTFMMICSLKLFWSEWFLMKNCFDNLCRRELGNKICFVLPTTVDNVWASKITFLLRLKIIKPPNNNAVWLK